MFGGSGLFGRLERGLKVICPRCNAELLRRERPDRKCSKCDRTFALEPKLTPAGLHDLRVLKLADKLSDGGRFQYTLTQFMLATARRRLPEITRVHGNVIGAWVILVVIVTYILCLTGFTGMAILALIGTGIGALVAGCVVLGVMRPLFVRYTRVPLPFDVAEYMDEVFDRWTTVYGRLPPGAVDERTVYPQHVEQPRLALLCTDASVLACLTVNQVPYTYQIALVRDLGSVPPVVPVLVLHDASPPGLELVAMARRSLGDRVVDVGIAPAMVMDNESAILLRERRVDRGRAKFVQEQPLAPREISWLIKGWWSPIAAIGPVRLLTAVSRAVERIESSDPDHRSARQVGFLTWPST